MKQLALFTVCVVAVAGLAGHALADTMDETFGNTVVITNAKGEVSKSWPKADGTFASEGPNGEKGSGTWALKDGKTCSTPNLPADAAPGTPPPTESCAEYQPNHKVGDKWTQPDADGNSVTVEIVKGM
jgi:hypothetical protein